MSESTPSRLSSRMARLNPFKTRARQEDDEDDAGEEIDAATFAGGGLGASTGTTHHPLCVSTALQSFLFHQGVLGNSDSDDVKGPLLKALLDKPVVTPPAYLLDRSHPLPEYFISSSHNTYLMSHQLFGASSAAAYETTLKAGARCIEIDAWDNPDNCTEPKVTHGYTLVSNIPFRVVCETIRDVVDHEETAARGRGYTPAPILVSLENHCDRNGQLRLVEIMKEVWGDRLLSAPIRQKGHEEQEGGDPVRLEDLGSKIAVIVEYHLPDEVDDSSTSSSSSSDSEEEKKARKEYKTKKNTAPPPIIVPELAELGVYAQSVKPRDDSWYVEGKVKDGPPEHHLINVSESGLASHTREHAPEIARHNARHLMRVYPKGTRISSRNLSPVPFWAVGAQICALNWQTFGASMQINDALFAGTAGYFEDNESVFVRMLIKSDASFSSNPILAVAAVRLLYLDPRGLDGRLGRSYIRRREYEPGDVSEG
ncbi:hypothetical protein CHGG_08329 [Chaetomium globosum CBS 148.51]|uniref:Phosphoinositide phospholipase C n=1 Tax=Chaetomium globosum (strain ATCC 6205 / CBS 148.51 / DSM 1962 / NBRC 6347 / NRRL 1970) TaxID=306901 RepID=Q2GUM5_CHAGB|nr:uncharacterized protein CHGG_08329 [Chaetomium globosum CBS 148.51]EAQ87076.1 hypothetical protein CHGG_08329 [Chaetomium globosum CBS 148.51]